MTVNNNNALKIIYHVLCHNNNNNNNKTKTSTFSKLVLKRMLVPIERKWFKNDKFETWITIKENIDFTFEINASDK